MALVLLCPFFIRLVPYGWPAARQLRMWALMGDNYIDRRQSMYLTPIRLGGRFWGRPLLRVFHLSNWRFISLQQRAVEVILISSVLCCHVPFA
jgi:hypothetical protein